MPPAFGRDGTIPMARYRTNVTRYGIRMMTRRVNTR